MIQTPWRTALFHPAALLILCTGLGLAAATGFLPGLRPWSHVAGWVAVLGLLGYASAAGLIRQIRPLDSTPELRVLSAIRRDAAAWLTQRRSEDDATSAELAQALTDVVGQLDEHLIPSVRQLVERNLVLTGRLMRQERVPLPSGELQRLQAVDARGQAALDETVQEIASSYAALRALRQDGHDDASAAEGARACAEQLSAVGERLAKLLDRDEASTPPATPAEPTPAPATLTGFASGSRGFEGLLVSDRYQVQGQLGQGGIASVYLAFDTRLELDVALKFVPAAIARGPQFLARFRREGQILAQLSHPHILRLFDMGEDSAHDVHYLVLEYLTGGTLKERAATVPWSVPAALEVLGPVAAALDYAHGRPSAVVHRDLKPSNIMFDGAHQPKISDFGIARILAPEGPDGAADAPASLTHLGMVIGTPFYMAPEQAHGQPAVPATDRYALGTIAYEMLTGRVPYLAETPQAVLARVMIDPPPPPHELNPSLSPAVEAVLLKAMAKEPADRFPTATGFVDALAQAAAEGQRSA